ncbi:MAG: TIGR04086 family membrane protein [Eubacteriaceae bacterium]|nr:TIGR04086 family membrane protein [Eubacteriaceae bacterium]
MAGSLENIFKKSKGMLLCFGLFLVLVAAWSLITYFFTIPYGVVSIISYSITTFCMIVASISNAFRSEGKGWLNGIIGGVSLLAMIVVFTLLFSPGAIVWSAVLKKFPLYVVICFICGVIGINLK